MTLWTISFFTAFMAIRGDHGIFSARSHMNPAVQKRECGSTQMLDFGVLISGTVSDLITVLIPLPMVYQNLIAYPRLLGSSPDTPGLLPPSSPIVRQDLYCGDISGRIAVCIGAYSESARAKFLQDPSELALRDFTLAYIPNSPPRIRSWTLDVS
jgi:hypothetical protein